MKKDKTIVTEEKKELEQDPLKKKKKIPYNAITGLIVVAILAIGFVVYVRPGLESLSDLSVKDAAVLEQEAITKENKLLSIKKFARALDELPTDTHEQLIEVLPNEPREVDLLANAVGLAKSSNLTLERVEILEPRSLPVEAIGQGAVTVRELQIQMEVDGLSYTVLKNFLINIERNIRMIRVDEFLYDPRRPDAQVKLTAFYLE